jgi:uncharacterized protein YyaL (SSP411 family)
MTLFDQICLPQLGNNCRTWFDKQCNFLFFLAEEEALEHGENMANRLQSELSPYLLQHAENPVDWYAWGPDAIERARLEDKPILVSIGYSACHWCHVMAHECFENPQMAAIQNQHFINIKIDREERPDLDEIYMQAVQLLTGRGGWPLNVFLTPDLKPFFGGTYFPPTPRHGLISWPDLLLRVADYYRTDQDKLREGQAQLWEHLKQLGEAKSEKGPLDDLAAKKLVEQLKQSFDPGYGGFGPAPKFPHAGDLQFLLAYAQRTGDAQAKEMALFTLTQMASGGLYDQIGGGFHRYSTDARWLVPHFEKMLYDNALLLKAYVDAYLVTKNEFYREIAEQIIAYVSREMTSDEGCFYSAQDADSEGGEGAFFVWTPTELQRVLGEAADDFMKYYGVTAVGNFEGATILHRANPVSEPLPAEIIQARHQLLVHRCKRSAPVTDTKILASWNGLMIAALAYAGKVLKEPSWLKMAEQAAGVIKQALWQEGVLKHVTKDGQAKINGMLEDNAYLAEAFLDLFEASGKADYLSDAQALVQMAIQQFATEDGAGFYQTVKGQSDVITRSRSATDHATPAPVAVMTHVLLRLGRLTKDETLISRATQILTAHAGSLTQMPRAYVTLIAAWEQHRVSLYVCQDGVCY